MLKSEINKYKNRCAKTLHSLKNLELENAVAIYMQFGLTINDKIEELDSYEEDFKETLLYNATHGWVKYLNDEIGKPVVFDFDLWADSFNFCKGLLDGIGYEYTGLTPFVETCQSVFVAMFRMWYEDITVQNIIDYFDGKPCPELPDMSDMRKTFLWAIDNDIPCTDMSSYRAYFEDVKNNQSAEEEIQGYYDMAKLRDTFDAYDENFIEYGIPKEYLDENRLQLREIFFAAVAFYEILPKKTEINEIIKETEQIYRYYEKFLGIHHFPGIDVENLGNSNDDMLFYYYVIFVLGLKTGEKLYKIDCENGFSQESLFKMAILQQMKKNK